VNWVKNRIWAFGCAMKGVWWFFRHEKNSLIYVLAIPTVIALGFWLEVSKKEWIALSLAMGLVLCAELINTAIEETIDLLHPDQHPQAGRVKDLASGAVWVASLAAAIVGAIVFVPKF
jgi:diacylglycerol kinase (ATP)